MNRSCVQFKILFAVVLTIYIWAENMTLHCMEIESEGSISPVRDVFNVVCWLFLKKVFIELSLYLIIIANKTTIFSSEKSQQHKL